jgi:hypothetical protein
MESIAICGVLPARAASVVASSGQTAVCQAACLRHHTDRNALLLSDDYVQVTIDLGDLSVEDLAQVPAAPRMFGDTWLQEQRTPVVRVRAREPNLLLNPAHPEAPTARILDTGRFTFDPRLWRPR